LIRLAFNASGRFDESRSLSPRASLPSADGP
jgi:hypothetical protein